MKILGVIPARGGSKGVPRKNIRILIDKPLIKYSIDAALNSRLSDVIVSTEDLEIANFAKECNCSAPFVRPEELATDNARSIDVAIHAIKTMEVLNNTFYDAIMLLQPTTPFRSSEDINNCIDLLENNIQVDSVISVVDVKAHHPARMKYIRNGILVDPDFCEKYENQNRQELEPMYIRNGAIYLTRRKTILESSFKGSVCLPYVMPESNSANIDTIEDFEFAEWTYYKSKNETSSFRI
ncbi:MAG: acylneuraminate cytidylyltransferase family protein [Rickettsiaceae bacterium]|nr:acylneuraminate cytidylyltransferase family protein [Rickettsiaceae bacterium]